MLFFLSFSLAFSHSFSCFWGSYEPLTLSIQPWNRKVSTLLSPAFSFMQKRMGFLFPPSFILLFIHIFIHTFSTEVSELCFYFATSLLWMSGVYYWVTTPLTSTPHTPHGSRGQDECHLNVSVLGNISTAFLSLSVDGNISITLVKYKGCSLLLCRFKWLTPNIYRQVFSQYLNIAINLFLNDTYA